MSLYIICYDKQAIFPRAYLEENCELCETGMTIIIYKDKLCIFLQPNGDHNVYFPSMFSNISWGGYNKLSTARADPELFFWPSKLLLVWFKIFGFCNAAINLERNLNVRPLNANFETESFRYHLMISWDVFQF